MQFLADRWLREETLSKVEQLRPIADELDVTLAQLALAWCMTNPRVSSVIMGATKVNQIEENLKALECANKMTPDVLEKIEKAVGGSELECGKQTAK